MNVMRIVMKDVIYNKKIVINMMENVFVKKGIMDIHVTQNVMKIVQNATKKMEHVINVKKVIMLKIKNV